MSQLTNKIITENYRLAYQQTTELVREQLKGAGFANDAAHPEFVELCQSVLGHESVVRLIQTETFAEPVYRPLLTAAITEVRRLLFPDTRKKQFVSIDALEWDVLVDEDATTAPEQRPEAGENVSPDQEKEGILQWLQQKLPAAQSDYLEKILLPRMPEWEERLTFLVRSIRLTGSRRLVEGISGKVELLQRFFPDGEVGSLAGLNIRERLTPAEIRQIYLHVYIGIEQGYPAYFLQYEGVRRSGIVLKFLVDEILQSDPEKILADNDPTFFIRHQLQNVYRHFNYSANRALGNAYPDVIMPWIKSRSDAHYWQERRNRIEAIRWLLEEQLCLNPQEFYREQISRDVFAQYGLSYMFNSHYNSVSRAIAEAYPELRPWQIGKVPFDFWNDETAAEAIRWMVARKGWTVERLPVLTADKLLNRKTFSEFGLATLFEKKFSKNIYKAISLAWPDRFEPWEFGRVASAYWQDRGNIFAASRWIANREGFDEHEILPAIRSRRFTIRSLKKYTIGAALRKLSGGDIERIFEPLFWQEQKLLLQEHRMMRKIGNLKRDQRIQSLLGYLLYGFFLHDVRKTSRQNLRRYDRMANRIKRRALNDTTKRR